MMVARRPLSAAFYSSPPRGPEAGVGNGLGTKRQVGPRQQGDDVNG